MKSSKIQDCFDLLTANGVGISENFKEFLKKAGFFDLPASTKFHGAEAGGLYAHSLAVAETLMVLTQRNQLEWERPGSPVVVGLFHDLCKLEAYEPVITERTKTVVKYGWQHRDGRDQLYTGHGDKSVLILAPWMQLTEEEVACIRWHMGAFDDQEQWSHYTAAICRFPNVLWTHHADMIASHILQR
ncbi:hypothetical protein D1841_13315 [Neglecta sp. X4]|nr:MULTISPECIES: hypothetical protein [unclassified Neglectibacter]NBI18542.1 hypothetical protein [Neglectibacter sp. 59]NBJ74226.1 hypothetical protein [Neglectibacter sp. X4]NCE81738.1 hypothetical protein [Neglectibacter sp. X58]